MQACGFTKDRIATQAIRSLVLRRRSLGQWLWLPCLDLHNGMPTAVVTIYIPQTCRPGMWCPFYLVSMSGEVKDPTLSLVVCNL